LVGRNTAEIQRLERDLSAAHQRINEMMREIDQRDELIFDLQRRIEELERAEGRSG
jgi:peptidoglycan hydrolase CwlO-like protein